jgi:hypothetical protein
LYYKKKGDLKPKGSFSIGKLTDCEVSELFVEKHQKDLIYCVRITWSVSSDGSAVNDDSNGIDEESTLGSGSRGSVGRSPTRAGRARIGLEQNDPTPVTTPTGKLRSSLLKKPGKARRSQSDAEETTPNHKRTRSLFSGRSVDAESLTLSTQMRHRRKSDNPTSKINETVAAGLAKIPQLVEVEERHAAMLQKPTHQRAVSNMETLATSTPALASNNARRTSWMSLEEENREEQEYLRAQYLTTKKENRRKSKQKFVKRTKVAAAVGATAGVAVVTAGVGLVAGMVALGVGVTAGGGSAAFGASWKKKNTGEVVIACSDYETAKLWKSLSTYSAWV